jgi:dihydrodiol dehydrogenase / D-xylose 1-dehydrogenase (NADP)
MKEKVNWGIIGAGRISRTFVNDLKLIPNANVIAVASKSMERAKTFAKEYNLKYYYDNYNDLLKNPEVDVVYIGTTHNYHYENMVLCMENNIPALCEKPFTVNSSEAIKIIDLAKEKNIFLMEAMWSRFIPAYKKVREIIESGIIGEIKFLSADLGFKAPNDPEHRAFNAKLAGGGLLDVGIYPISLAYWVFGKNPQKIYTTANIGKTGVDEEAAMIFHYTDGEMAILSSAITTETPKEAFIVGEKGTIKMHSPFFHTKKITLRTASGEEEFNFEYDGLGYQYEAMQVMDLLKNNKKESGLMPLNETLEIIMTLDKIRKEWNLIYPFENAL